MYALDGWQFSTIITAQSGFPDFVVSNLQTTGTGLVTRPDRIARGNLSSGDRCWKRWFNTAACVNTPYGRYGTSPRTEAFRLTGVFKFDFSMNESFRIREKTAFEFRAEMFNLFNHYNPDPATVDNNLNSAALGAVGLGVSGIATRVIQFGAKFRF